MFLRLSNNRNVGLVMLSKSKKLLETFTNSFTVAEVVVCAESSVTRAGSKLKDLFHVASDDSSITFHPCFSLPAEQPRTTPSPLSKNT